MAVTVPYSDLGLTPTTVALCSAGLPQVQGSFDNWTTRSPLHQHGKDFTLVKMLLPGVYQYKFIVDGEWKYAPDQVRGPRHAHSCPIPCPLQSTTATLKRKRHVKCM